MCSFHFEPTAKIHYKTFPELSHSQNSDSRAKLNQANTIRISHTLSQTTHKTERTATPVNIVLK